jgi:hypothetical protein
MLPGYPACDTMLRMYLFRLVYHQDRTQCATTGTPPRRAAGVIRRYEALGTTYPHPIRVAGLPVREPDDYQHQGGRGPGWMAWLTQVNCRSTS